MERKALERAVQQGLREFDAELDILEQVVAGKLGLSRTDGRALEIIDRCEGVTPGQLAKDLGYTPSAMTVMINRMEAAGLVTRTLSEEDRRRLAVRTTDRGREMVRGFFVQFGARIQQVLGPMSDEQLAAVAAFLEACSRQAGDYRALLVARDRP
jgi:DNA-binding MarR family transcriptional regulator